tara:strand:- start:1884 stop:2600 length:717 start_codon:yes stop_codon:yes gene_type:complete
MLVLDKYQLIFIISPRVASKSIINIYCQLKGIIDYNYQTEFKPDILLREKKYNSYKIIWFIRCPFKRLVSCFYDICSNRDTIKLIKNKSYKQCSNLLLNGHISFKLFLDLLFTIDRNEINDIFLPQTFNKEFIFFKNSLYLYDIENLTKFNEYLSDRLNIKNKNIEIPKKYINHVYFDKQFENYISSYFETMVEQEYDTYKEIDKKYINMIINYYINDFYLLNYINNYNIRRKILQNY